MPARAKRAILGLLVLLWTASAAAEPLKFRVRWTPESPQSPVSGRLYVFLSQHANQPRFGPNWFHPEPFFGIDVQQFQPGTSQDVDQRADGFPAPLAQLRPGEYRIQAVLDHSFQQALPGNAPGNFYSTPIKASLAPDSTGTVELILNHEIQPEKFPESRWVQELIVPSERLSAYHHRPVVEGAAVVLPSSYFDQPERRYPVVFIISGFGGNYRKMAVDYVQGPAPPGTGEVEFIRVLLDGQCRWGHHEYANSATNGPRGDALVHEMIPELDRRYRTIADSGARFLSGHSSGGWSSLWLQVQYPETFGGVWSLAPDPVDFHDFQQVDLYANPPLSLYDDPQGRPRPIARVGAEPILWYRPFVAMDDVLKRGGQIRSFEAVFSPLGADGQPQRMFDRSSGRVDPTVADAWRSYDLCDLLQRGWPTLGPKLQGKLHIFAAERDTFYLEGAVRRLADALRRLGSDAEVKVVPGTDHMTLVSRELQREIRQAMSRAFLQTHPQ